MSATNRKNIYLSILSFLLLSSFSLDKRKCTTSGLYGSWEFINSYKGKLTEIDSLKKKTYESNYGTPVMTFKETGEFINDQGDYKSKGKFILDKRKCLIKEFDAYQARMDTSFYEIGYLDSQYLLIIKEDSQPYSYFYKRK